MDGLFATKNVDVYITGSNAFLLSSELATLLSGRYIEISILPFSFNEYLTARNIDTNNKNVSKSNAILDIDRYCNQNIKFPICFLFGF